MMGIGTKAELWKSQRPLLQRIAQSLRYPAKQSFGRGF